MIAAILKDSYEVIFVDNLEKGKTISGEYYAVLLQQLHTLRANFRIWPAR